MDEGLSEDDEKNLEEIKGKAERDEIEGKEVSNEEEQRQEDCSTALRCMQGK